MGTVTRTVKGSLASFKTCLKRPLQELKVSFGPTQEGSGDPSPENQRKIVELIGINVEHTGSVISVSWQTEAGEVCGGYIDLVSGELAAEWSAATYTGAATEDWQLETTGLYKIYRSGIVSTDASDVSSVLSSYLPTKSRSSIYGGSVVDGICLRDGTHIWVRAGSVAVDLTSWKSYLAAHPLQVAYKLATPVHYQLTPQQIETLIGRNNIWSPQGSVSVKYLDKDTKDLLWAKRRAIIATRDNSKYTVVQSSFQLTATSNSFTTVSATSYVPGDTITATVKSVDTSQSVTRYVNGYFTLQTPNLTFGNNYIFEANVEVIEDKLGSNLVGISSVGIGATEARANIANGKIRIPFTFVQKSGSTDKYLEFHCGGKSMRLRNIRILE